MFCKKCKNKRLFRDNLYIHKENKIIRTTMFCNNCSYVLKYIIHKKLNESNYFQFHLPGYNYCGPGTHVLNNLKKNITPINRIDKECMKHDINYLLGIKTVNESDDLFLRSLLRLKSLNIIEYITVLIIIPVIKFKKCINLFI